MADEVKAEIIHWLLTENTGLQAGYYRAVRLLVDKKDLEEIDNFIAPYLDNLKTFRRTQSLDEVVKLLKESRK